MFTDPEKNVLEFGLMPGQKVVDLGSGAGHYAAALSKVLGESGRIYAIDLDKDMLVKLKKSAIAEGKVNVEVIWGDIEKPHGTKLKDEVVDAAVLSNILFQLGDKQGAIDETKRILKSGGKLCVVEWADLSFLSGTLMGRARQAVTEAQAEELFGKSGFSFERRFDAGESHYGLIFKKPLQ